MPTDTPTEALVPQKKKPPTLAEIAELFRRSASDEGLELPAQKLAARMAVAVAVVDQRVRQLAAQMKALDQVLAKLFQQLGPLLALIQEQEQQEQAQRAEAAPPAPNEEPQAEAPQGAADPELQQALDLAAQVLQEGEEPGAAGASGGLEPAAVPAPAAQAMPPIPPLPARRPGPRPQKRGPQNGSAS